MTFEPGIAVDKADIFEQASASQAPFRTWPESLRALWRQENLRNRRRELPFVHALGLAGCLLCLAFDYLAGPEAFKAGLVLRAGVFAPLSILAILVATFGGRALQNCTSMLTVPCFAVVAAYPGTHVAPEYAREYVMASGMVIAMAAVIFPLRPMTMAATVVLSLAGIWTLRATMPPLSVPGDLDAVFAFVTLFSLVALVIPVRATRLKDRNFLHVVHAGLVSEQLQAANEELRRLSDRDDLTDLLNRRSFERICEAAFRSSVERGSDLAVLMVDADRFKQFNDSHGHLAGDRALKQIALTLRSELRAPACTVARFGGEEFIVLVEDCPAENVVQTADAARRAVADRPIALHKNLSISVTVSIGVAMRTLADRSAMALIERADAALYEAKQAGRNIVRQAACGEGEPSPALVKQSA